MKSRRHATSATFVACIALFLSFTLSPSTYAQQRPEQKPSPSPEKKDLLTVQPAAPQVSVDSSPPKQQPGDPQKKPGEIDDKGPVITNTDLITFTVTVTDIYGRFVSGLSKNAFSIFDDKQQQNISFFSDS